MESYVELHRDTEIYEEVLVKSILLQLNMTKQELRRATESYGELGREMV